MRRFLAVLAAVAFTAAAPASADPAARVVVLNGRAGDVSVACDTSAYPAATYPCDFALVVTAGCVDIAVGSGPCRLTVRGSLLAYPGYSPYDCVLRPDGPWRLTFETAGDPAFVVDEPVGSYGIVPRVVASAGAQGVETPFVADITPVSVLLSRYTVAGAIVAPFEFSDLEPDCRTRAGGSPQNDVAPGTVAHLAAVGTVVLTRI